MMLGLDWGAFDKLHSLDVPKAYKRNSALPAPDMNVTVHIQATQAMMSKRWHCKHLCSWISTLLSTLISTLFFIGFHNIAVNSFSKFTKKMFVRYLDPTYFVFTLHKHKYFCGENSRMHQLLCFHWSTVASKQDSKPWKLHLEHSMWPSWRLQTPGTNCLPSRFQRLLFRQHHPNGSSSRRIAPSTSALGAAAVSCPLTVIFFCCFFFMKTTVDSVMTYSSTALTF